MSNYFIRENFDKPPVDWYEIGEIVTYNAVNKNIEAECIWTSTVNRYSKKHSDLTIDDSFYMEFKFERTADAPNMSYAYVGSFNKNKGNMFGDAVKIVFYYGPWLEFMGHFFYGQVTYNDVTNDITGMTTYKLLKDVEYLFKIWCNGTNRMFTLRLYKVVPNFNEFILEQTIEMSISKTFTVNDFGIGNVDLQSDPMKIYKFNYDDALLMKFPDTAKIIKPEIGKIVSIIKGKGD